MPLAILLSRVLDRGVVLTGDVVIGVAGVDLLYLGLDLVLTSVESLEAASGDARRVEDGRRGAGAGA